MKTSSLCAALVAALSLGSLASAQSTAPGRGASLLGARTAELGFGYVDVNASSVDAFAGNLSLNLPVATGVDLTASYTHSWVEGHGNLNAELLDVGVVGYRDLGAVTAFGQLTLGYDWAEYGWADDFVWGVRAGAEYSPTQTVTLIGSVGYDDGFDSSTEGAFDGTVRINYRASDKLVPYLSATWLEGGSIGASIGVAYRF